MLALAEKRVEEVVRIAVVALPAAERALELIGAAVIPVLGPLLGLDVGLDADLGPVLLDRGARRSPTGLYPRGMV